MLANTSFRNPVTPEPTVWLVAQAMPHASMPRAGSRYSKCNFVKLQTACNLNICKRDILTEGFQPLISVGGCITASPLPFFKPNHTELRCCYKEQHCEHTGLVQIVFRLQSNHSQIALRIKPKKAPSQKYFFQVEHQVLFWEHFHWRKRKFWEGSLTASPHTYSADYLLPWVQPTLSVKKNKDLDLDLPLWGLSPVGYRGTTTLFTSVFIFWKGTTFSTFMFGWKSCWIQSGFWIALGQLKRCFWSLSYLQGRGGCWNNYLALLRIYMPAYSESCCSLTPLSLSVCE